MLNVRDEELFNKVLELETNLGQTGYGPTYYQLLGVNLDCNKEELEKNPLCDGEYRSTKGKAEDNISFDDRTYIRFRVE